MIVPVGRTRPASYEASKRKAHSTIALEARAADDETAPAPRFDGPLVRDPAEARAWQRGALVGGWLVPVFFFAPLVQVLGGAALWWGLGAVGLMLAAQSVVLWSRRRLLNRFAGRLPGPPVSGRSSRREAREAVSAYLNSPAGQVELASHLGITTEALRASDRRHARVMVAGMAASGLVFLALMVSLALS